MIKKTISQINNKKSRTHNVNPGNVLKGAAGGHVVDEAGDVAVDLVRLQRVRDARDGHLAQRQVLLLPVHLHRVDAALARALAVAALLGRLDFLSINFQGHVLRSFKFKCKLVGHTCENSFIHQISSMYYLKCGDQ